MLDPVHGPDVSPMLEYFLPDQEGIWWVRIPAEYRSVKYTEERFVSNQQENVFIQFMATTNGTHSN